MTRESADRPGNPNAEPAMTETTGPETSTPETTPEQVQQQAETIVAEGGDVRARIARLVAEASESFQRRGEGLVALTRSVLAGAGDAVNKGVSSVSAEGSFRQVIDGLGDGLSSAATSARLAMEEARSKGQRFAAEDLHQIRTDLKNLTSLYSKTLSDALARVRTEASSQFGDLQEHAERTLERVGPSVQSALEAAMADPLGVGKDSVQAGLAASRHAAGSLFTTIGRLLQDAGERLTGTDRPEA